MLNETFTKRIVSYEINCCESFFDQFAHDRINRERWTEFLKAKGFSEKAIFIENMDKEEYFSDCFAPFDVFDASYEENEDLELHTKNVSLVVEYILKQGANLLLEEFLTENNA